MRAKGFAAPVVLLPAGAGADEDESAGDRAAMQGDWTMVSSEVNGESAPDEALKAGRLRVTDARYAVAFDGRRMSYALRLEPSTDPKAIELTVEMGPDQGQVIKGIYKLEADRLTICHGLTAQNDRPVEFSTGAESGHTLIVWKRAKAGGK